MASSRSDRRAPEGCYRERLCLKCKAMLQADGYLVNNEPNSYGVARCARCGKGGGTTAMYRYTLSWRERQNRGMT